MSRALVLCGGGPVGIAWGAGLLAGFEERGVSLTGADAIVGTSAGSVVGAWVATGGRLEEPWHRFAPGTMPRTSTPAPSQRA